MHRASGPIGPALYRRTRLHGVEWAVLGVGIVAAAIAFATFTLQRNSTTLERNSSDELRRDRHAEGDVTANKGQIDFGYYTPSPCCSIHIPDDPEYPIRSPKAAMVGDLFDGKLERLARNPAGDGWFVHIQVADRGGRRLSETAMSSQLARTPWKVMFTDPRGDIWLRTSGGRTEHAR